MLLTMPSIQRRALTQNDLLVQAVYALHCRSIVNLLFSILKMKCKLKALHVAPGQALVGVGSAGLGPSMKQLLNPQSGAQGSWRHNVQRVCAASGAREGVLSLSDRAANGPLISHRVQCLNRHSHHQPCRAHGAEQFCSVCKE